MLNSVRRKQLQTELLLVVLLPSQLLTPSRPGPSNLPPSALSECQAALLSWTLSANHRHLRVGRTCLRIFASLKPQQALAQVGVLVLEGLGVGSTPLSPPDPQPAFTPFLFGCCGLPPFPRLNVKGNAFYSHRPPGPPSFLRCTWLRGSGRGLQSHSMSLGKSFHEA